MHCLLVCLSMGPSSEWMNMEFGMICTPGGDFRRPYELASHPRVYLEFRLEVCFYICVRNPCYNQMKSMANLRVLFERTPGYGA